jgi:hypothetical protein
MAAQGVLEKIGMLMASHHFVVGYNRYDRTKDLKMEAANVVSCNPELTWKTRMDKVSRKILEEQDVGLMLTLSPLMGGALRKTLAFALKQKFVCRFASLNAHL